MTEDFETAAVRPRDGRPRTWRTLADIIQDDPEMARTYHRLQADREGLREKYGPDGPPPPAPPCPTCRGALWVQSKNLDPSQNNPEAPLEPCPACYRQTWEAQRRMRALGESGLERHTGDTFDNKAPPPEWRWVWQTGKDWAEDPHGWLWIHGVYYSGKSTLCRCIGNHMQARGRAVAYRRVADLMDGLRETFDKSSEVRFEDRFRALLTADVLILDDLGQEEEPLTAFEKKALFRLAEYRLEPLLPTVVTTNWSIARLRQDWPRMYPRVTDAQKTFILPFPADTIVPLEG